MEISMAGYPHPRNLIRENLDLTAIREIYMPRKIPGIRYLMFLRNFGNTTTPKQLIFCSQIPIHTSYFSKENFFETLEDVLNYHI